MSLNESQKRLVDATEGMIVVDAGPGTGKTHTVTARCVNILKKSKTPKDLMMLTFTRNAADEMRERVQKTIDDWHSGNEPGYELNDNEYRHVYELSKQITIGTFDSFCLSIVKQSPSVISRFFGFDETLTSSADIIENSSVNLVYFRRFLDRFLLVNGDRYGDDAAIAAENPNDLYHLLNSLMSRGILPLKNGPTGRAAWFGGDDGQILIGDTDRLEELVSNINAKKFLSSFEDNPELEGVDEGSLLQKILDEAVAEDRTRMLLMIHDIYYEYIRRCISDDHLTFGLTACFAFVILYSDDKSRERARRKSLIVDEFQDTNSNQMMISLMILEEPNLCVVGDWKQGIYGFRFVSIENITDFENRVVSFRRFLNDDRKRIPFSIPETLNLSLKENYRSSQLIIDKAFESLEIKGSDSEEMDLEDIRSKITKIVASNTELNGNTAFELVECNDKKSEVMEVLHAIETYVHTDKYPVFRKGVEGPQQARYGDIAVLCRTSGMCRDVYNACNEHGIPAFIQGDLEVMRSREGKLLLAWLKLLSNDGDRWGFVPILADMGYSSDEIKEMGIRLPQVILDQKKNLRSRKRRITDLISEIFHFYALDNDITQAIISELSSSHRSSLLTISDMVSIIESDISNSTKYDIDGIPDVNAVIIQTLHKSKGLEYPIVIIPGVDQGNLPSTSSDRRKYSFDEISGVRCKDAVIHFGDEMKLGKSWRTSAVHQAIPKDYSEERRLLFVGISRAKQYVKMMANMKRPSQFFKYYSEGGTLPQTEGELPHYEKEGTKPIERPFIPSFESRRRNIGVHDILIFQRGSFEPDFDYEDRDGTGRGMAFGTSVHRIAELMATGHYVPTDKDMELYGKQIRRIKQVLKDIGDAFIDTEVECSLPRNEYNVTLRGIVDLLAVSSDKVEIHDWKTDNQFDFREEYMIQLSVYAHVMKSLYPDHEIKCVLNWISMENDVPNHPMDDEFEPLPLSIIDKRIEGYLHQ